MGVSFVRVSVFVAPHGASPTRTSVPLEHKSAPKSGPAHFTNTFTPVNLLSKKIRSEADTWDVKASINCFSVEQAVIKNITTAHTWNKTSWMCAWNTATCWQSTTTLYTWWFYLPITHPQGVPETRLCSIILGNPPFFWIGIYFFAPSPNLPAKMLILKHNFCSTRFSNAFSILCWLHKSPIHFCERRRRSRVFFLPFLQGSWYQQWK